VDTAVQELGPGARGWLRPKRYVEKYDIAMSTLYVWEANGWVRPNFGRFLTEAAEKT
jgi:hypothetical protein